MLLPMKKRIQSRKRKQPDKELSLELCTYDQSWPKNTKDAYVGPPKSPEEIRATQRLKSFNVRSHEDDEEEKLTGVSTKLKLLEDPWKIRKKLVESDCNSLCRLIVGKDLVQKHIIDVWNRVGKGDDVAKIGTRDGVDVKVLDYDMGVEHVLKFKKLPSSECYVFGHNWSSKFVKRRNLRREDEIGLYWNSLHSRFDLSVLARSPAP